MRNITTQPLTRAGILLALVFGLCIELSGSASPPGQSKAFDKGRAECGDDSLAEWNDIWVRWAVGNIDVDEDANGNAVVGKTVLMAVPPTPDDGTRGSIKLTLSSDQSFFLPLWGLWGTSYSNGTPPDKMVSQRIFKTLNITVKIDGATVINNRNVMDYFSEFRFDPEIPLGDMAVIWLQGIGMTHAPLSVGKHTITLDARNTRPLPVPEFPSAYAEYHNTWNITVKADRQRRDDRGHLQNRDDDGASQRDNQL